MIHGSRAALAALLLLPIACRSTPAPAPERPPGARGDALDVARAHGLDRFHTVQELQFTFVAELPDRLVRRSWSWWPQRGLVERRAPGEPLRFRPDEAGPDASEPVREAHAQFVNDSYWLLFPLHLAWDQETSLEVDLAAPPFPAERTRHRIVVTYPPEGGFTPGDVYEVYVTEDQRIAAWIYRRGGSRTPTRQTTWTHHARLGPLLVSLQRSSPSGDLQVRLEDLHVRVAERAEDEGEWFAPEPVAR